VHRVGPNRLYVNLARRLARSGFTVLRFDHSGVGDSQPREDHLPFGESSVAEAVDAMNFLAADRQCDKFALVGLCSGTLTAFRTAYVDARVTSLVLLTALLLDPSTVPEEIIAEALDRRVARSYLVEKIGSMHAWRKVLSGGADIAAIWRVLQRRIAKRISPPSIAPGTEELIAQMRDLLQRGVAVRFVFADPATVLEGFRMTIAPALRDLRERGRIDVRLIKRADHTFTRLRHQAEVIELTSEWLLRCT
jgi:pimeloyl-ACP methyl ester carboxylesterase